MTNFACKCDLELELARVLAAGEDDLDRGVLVFPAQAELVDTNSVGFIDSLRGVGNLAEFHLIHQFS